MNVRGSKLAAGAAVLALILMAANPAVSTAQGLATDGSWLTVNTAGDVRIEESTTPVGPELSVVDNGATGFQVTVQTPGLTAAPHKTDAGVFVRVRLPGQPVAGEIGAPGIPVVRRLFVAPAGAYVTVSARVGAAYLVDQSIVGPPLRLTPVQPPIEKIPGALENAEFIYDEAAYSVDGDYAPSRATITDLGIVRGQRLMLLEVWPVSYNPVAEEMTFWPRIVADVEFAGAVPPDAGLSPLPNLGRNVLNPSVIPAVGGRGTGNYLIVVAETFEAAIAAFAGAKEAQGFTVDTYPVPAGTSNTQIKSHIQSLYSNPLTAPEYVLLVGDTNTIPCWIGGGSGSPDTDLNYVCMDGIGDWYPDIAKGRFPVRSLAQLDALVAKTLYYEDGPMADPQYVKRAVFMAGNDNYTISEGTHNYCINTYLEPNDYICDRLYMVTYGATTQDVRDSFNDGRFYGVFSGHGSPSGWGDGPPFYQDDVRALTNLNTYAFICSFSCSTGAYAETECFTETWVIEEDKAGLASWGSSVSSYWTEDDILQRVLFDAIFDPEGEVKIEAGPIYNEARVRYLEHFGPGGTTRRYFEMYNLMGDPSLPLPTNCSDAGTITLDRSTYACESTATIEVADCGLNLDENLVETTTVTIDSDSEPSGEAVLLTETGANTATFVGSIDLSETNAVGVLLVAEGDTVTVTYIDADNGQGGYNIVVTATATVDCTPPVISNVEVIDIQPRSATIELATDEPARAIVHYGPNCGYLPHTAVGSGYSTTPTVTLTGLDTSTTYYFMAEAEDLAGNLGVEGNCYSFDTPDIPDFFTELFGTNDLEGLSLIFTPNGSISSYAGCAEEIISLPTDPTGGTSLPLSDDDYEAVTVGTAVSLYGVNYSTFYVGSNGYITFGGGDTDYTESLEDHFDMPRISGVFDDLNPSSGGTVSWKQLADRVAVTWQNVPEYYSTGANTFQIELFFDGTITLSYLTLSVSDGLAGLSEGNGLDPDFFMSDLSEMGDCGMLGDLNCDGVLDAFDIDPFVLALTDPAGYATAWPNCDRMLADMNGDGVVNAFDIDPFVDLIVP